MEVKLDKVISEAEDIKSFFWKTEKKIDFLPGQYFYYTLPKLKFEDSRGPTRHFTISSSPTEGNFLRLTTQLRKQSGYKQTLDSLKLGDVIKGEGPEGTFTLDEKVNSRNHIFLAGGIGITPFRSLIKYNIDRKLNIPMYLIYSNSNADFVFEKEISGWADKNKNIKVWYIDSSKSGHLNGDTITHLTSQIRDPIYWCSGPPVFVRAMEEELEKMKILSENIRTDKFTGY